MNEKRAAIRDRFLASIRVRPAIMGILNITPDSFSDGGQFLAPESALQHARAMVAEGCDIIDIGGESTRPGFRALSADEELSRVLPILSQLHKITDIPISIDTTKSSVARQASELGAVVINDVWGLQKDLEMARVVAETESAVVVMHNRGEIDGSLDIFAEFQRFFDASLAIAERAGIPRSHILLDPGIGFGKSLEQNLAAIWGLDRLREYGLPILLGLSRKSFIGKVLGNSVHQRLTGTLASNMVGLIRGASILRVHDVAAHREALAMFNALKGPSHE